MLVVLFWVFISVVSLGLLFLVHFLVGLKLLPFFLNYEMIKHGEKKCYDCIDVFNLGRSADFYRHVSLLGRDKWEEMNKEERDKVRETYRVREEFDGVREYEASLEHCKRRANKKASAWLKYLPKVLKDQSLDKALTDIGDEKKRLHEIDLAVQRYRAEELTPVEAWDKLFELAKSSTEE